MSRSYKGPFGHVIPLEEDQSTPLPEEYQPPPFTMMTTNVRQLPLPASLNFGSDPRPGYSTNPNRNASASGYHASSRPGSSSEKLPPVSHLLTPASPAGSAASAYSSRAGYPHADASLGHSPTGYPSAAGRSPYVTGGYDHYPSAYHASPSPSSHPYAAPPLNTSSLHAPRRPPSDAWYSPDGAGGAYDGLPSPHPSNGESGSSRPVVKLIGERVFPGEGVCYVYDDGSHVRKVIDGEAVNAQWGVTKAGKPRKRLAIACITCREKKIKCDPAEPKCVQCDKAGRECRFQTA